MSLFQKVFTINIDLLNIPTPYPPLPLTLILNLKIQNIDPVWVPEFLDWEILTHSDSTHKETNYSI